MRYWACFFLACAAPSAALSQPPRTSCNCKNVLLVANGAGDEGVISENMAVAAAGLPLLVRRVDWGTGDLRVDIRDQEAHRRVGQCLASEVAARRKLQPDGKIYLMGYSAGTAVILEAAERSPPGSVDRIVLLGAGVSSRHPLGPALRCTRCGIDCFYSEGDAILGLFVDVHGTADLGEAPAAGNVGFQAPRLPAKALAQPILRQYPWREAWEESGHFGNHLGYTRVAFLRDYVVPLVSK